MPVAERQILNGPGAYGRLGGLLIDERGI